MHGPVWVAVGGRHLAHADGMPFLYLADTAWNGALLSSDADWREYLSDRADKGFTAIQFIVAAPWVGAYTDADGRTAYVADDALGAVEYHINEAFFGRMDQRVRAINEAGLLAVPVLAWAAKFGPSRKMNPGVSLPRRFLQRFVEYQVARYQDLHVMWVLAGDGRYGGWRSMKWKRIGCALFGDHGEGRTPVALHPMGKDWPYRSFRRSAWLDVLGYQTSHADDPDTLRWMLTGPPATAWQRTTRPIINLEPCYEGIRNWARPDAGAIDNADVRRALYASLLNGPTAGVAYGAHGIWSWETTPREPLNHPGSLIAPSWREALSYPGSFDVRRLARLFTSLEWWRLRPDRDLLRCQPGVHDPKKFVSAAATESRDLALLYLPAGGTAELKVTRSDRAEWFDPRTAERHGASITSDGRATAPDTEDWLLLLTRPVAKA